jgi:ankyrin repeat protein
MEKRNEAKKDECALETKEDEEKTLKALKEAAENALGNKADMDEDSFAAALEVLKRTMELSIEDLRQEAAIEEGEDSVLHFAAANSFPLDAIVRLIEVIDIDAQGKNDETAVMKCAYWWHHELLNELANMKADLSIVNGRGVNIFDHANENHRAVRNEEKAKLLKVLAEHGVTSAKIPKGFRSTLHESTIIPEPKRLAEEKNGLRFYFRLMLLTNEQLVVEGKELYEDGGYPLKNAIALNMDVAIERIHEASCSLINAKDPFGDSAINSAVLLGNVMNVHLLATMGADLSPRNELGETVLDQVQYCDESDEASPVKTALYSALAEHGVTSHDIPANFQSPLYFKSKYYATNVREQRWLERRVFMMCLNRTFTWSLANQIESERLMTLPPTGFLSSEGLFIARCCMHVDASSVSNGIARLIMQFAFGFNRRLIGMPREGAGAE